MKNIKKYIGVFATGMALLAMPSCSDTWDDHYNAGAGTNATLTLWEQIQANPNLANFAKVAEKAIYYKDQVHPLTNPKTGKPYTYKDVFSGTQLMTVWAPENSAFTDADVEFWLKTLETSPYTVHQQLMSNTVALWRNHISGDKIDTLQMLNGKNMVFNMADQTMQDIPLNVVNVESTNGTLHTLTKNIPFEYNIYEFAKDGINAASYGITRFHDYVISTDTTYFNENGSIEGNPDINGNPTYVDSAYINTNMMFFGTKRLTTSNSDKNLTYMESFGANIQAEDSDFVMIFPTDAAWDNAYKKLEPLYKYASIYVDNNKSTESTTIYREMGTPEQIDSLTQQSINMDIISPLCFNAHKQPKEFTTGLPWNATDFIDADDARLKYYLNTYNDTLRSDESFTKNILFGGKRVKMSNGWGVIADEWSFPVKFYNPDLVVEIGWQSFYNKLKSSGSYTPYAFSKAALFDPDTVGRVSFNNFYELQPSSENNPATMNFRLVGTDSDNNEAEVMSATYDIYLVCVPDFYKTADDTVSIGDTVRHNITATVNYCNNDPKGKDATFKMKNAVVYKGEKVEAIRLIENFTFPYSYKNLRHSFPTLTISTSSTRDERNPAKTWPVFRNNLCIDRILLVRKETPGSLLARPY